MPPNTSTPIDILLVEDNPNDAEQMVEALNEGDLPVRITHVEDGEEAVQHLQRPEQTLPDLILLDLHLPRLSGHEVLAVIKEDARLRRIPVVILTNSDDDREFTRAYDGHANCCVQKPRDLDQFIETVQKIERFWSREATRPRLH